MLETLLHHLPSFASGLFAGFLCCALLAWAQKKFVNAMIPVVFATLPLATNSLNFIFPTNLHLDVVSNISGWALGFFGTFFFHARSVIRQGIPFASILSGTARDILKQKHKLDEKKRELEHKKKIFIERVKAHKNEIKREKSRISKREKELHNKKCEFENDTKERTFDIISEDREFISSHNVRQCSKFHRRVVRAMTFVSKITDDCSKTTKERLEQESNPINKIFITYDDTKAYLKDIAMTLNHHLIRGDGTRVFFRMQDPDLVYKSVTGFYGNKKKEWPHAISDMPFKDTLIERSFQNEGMPIIYSLNTSYAKSPNGQWQDFLTIAPPKPSFNQGYPLLTLSISVEDSGGYIDFFKFLCHTRFDRVLSHTMEEYFSIVSDIDDDLISKAIAFAQNQNTGMRL